MYIEMHMATTCGTDVGHTFFATPTPDVAHMWQLSGDGQRRIAQRIEC